MKRSHKIALWVGGGVIALPVMIAYGASNDTTAPEPITAVTTTEDTPTPSPSAKPDDRPTSEEVLAALASQTGHAKPEDACPSISWMCNVEKVTVHTGGNIDIQYSDLSGIDTEQAARAIHNMLSAAELFPEVHVIRVMGPDGWERAKYGSYL